MKKRNSHVKILPLLLAGALLLTACGGQTADEAQPNEPDSAKMQNTEQENAAPQNTAETDSVPEARSVTVNSSEAVSVVPDMAIVVYSVRTESGGLSAEERGVRGAGGRTAEGARRGREIDPNLGFLHAAHVRLQRQYRKDHRI